MVKDLRNNKIICEQKFVRLDEMAKLYQLDIEEMDSLAKAAGAKFRLAKIKLVCKKELDEFMKHLYKVKDTNKVVNKKYVRIGEGSMIYSIGHHRFIEMARAAGAVYKIGDAQGATVLINLELFDKYMERFHELPQEMKNPLKELNNDGGI